MGRARVSLSFSWQRNNALSDPLFGDLFINLENKVLSECGIAGGLFTVAIIYLTLQLSRKNTWIEKYITTTNESYLKVVESNDKLRELILMFKDR